ncbi:hypothetical protein Ddye_019954 [Dipteronia dyeriana]|uniref:SWIM-type domain-containing protein n=1 Tax=Dipteronia dyeriana TaxID=168575 RepID=A0AAD9WUX4_9ROSI|nr:hypothetical protein Ddye_019954 [Dipteronia dyeriana]
MTDKQKGLVETIGEIWKNSEHRNCVRHLYANFKKKFKTYGIQTKVWEAANATTVEDFNRVMTKIKDMNEKAHEWLCEKPAKQWSKSHFRDWSKCDILLNNLCESVNGDRVILEERSAPIFSMLEMIRVKIMNRKAKRRIDLEKWYQNIGPRVAEFMELQTQHSGQFVTHWGGEGHYQINRGSIAYAVMDLDQRTCTCRIWNLTGIPCSHSMAAIYRKGDNPTKYVDKWYFKDTYKKCYSSVLHGIRTEELWFKTNMPLLLPPKDVKQTGRPRKLRIKEIGEIPPNVRKIKHMQKKYTCSKCNQEGHSAKTCEKRAELRAKLKKKVQYLINCVMISWVVLE